MAKIILSKERRQADRIVRSIPQPVKVAERLNISRQLARYHINTLYPRILEELIIVLDMAGYEIREKE